MSETKDWLAMLGQATTYRELQAAVSQLFADAASTNDPTALGEAIDEAIRRIEQERVRDQAELESDSAEYDAFKQQQAGVFGWLKRKMPFTETRRQDVQHREAVNEQKAEVLADNFVIARAQMLKERLLPASGRRMGPKLDEWQKRLLIHESIDGIREYGGVVLGLAQAVTTASAFVKNIEIDIAAFAQADFADKSDRGRRDSDLQVGRDELKALRDEIQNKENLRASAIKRLSELVRDELFSRDMDFRNTTARSKQLGEFLNQFPRMLKAVDDRLTECRALLPKIKELQSIPHLLEKQQREYQSMRRRCDESESRLAAANRELTSPSLQYEAAARNLEQAKIAFNATKPMYDAYIAEQQGGSTTSPVVAEHERMQSAVAQAEGVYQRLAPDFERLKRLFDSAKAEAAADALKLEENVRCTAKLNDDQSKLENECRSAKERLQWGKNDYTEIENGYATHLQEFSWLTEFSQLKGVPAATQSPFATRAVGSGAHDMNWEQRELNNEVDHLDKHAKSLRADQELIRISLAKHNATKLAALKQRSLMLLDASIAGELKFDSID